MAGPWRAQSGLHGSELGSGEGRSCTCAGSRLSAPRGSVNEIERWSSVPLRIARKRAPIMTPEECGHSYNRKPEDFEPVVGLWMTMRRFIFNLLARIVRRYEKPPRKNSLQSGGV